MKKTVVIGASTNPERYAFKAIEMLREYGHPVIAVGLKEGVVGDVEIQKNMPTEKEIDTVTLYVGPQRQPDYYDTIIALSPKRIVFNPGTENEEFIALATQAGIECLKACTLVLLRTSEY